MSTKLEDVKIFNVLTLHDTRNSSIVLELVEGLLQHVLRVNLLHTQQVQDHIIGEVEGAVQRVSRALSAERERKERIHVELITV